MIDQGFEYICLLKKKKRKEEKKGGYLDLLNQVNKEAKVHTFQP